MILSFILMDDVIASNDKFQNRIAPSPILASVIPSGESADEDKS